MCMSSPDQFGNLKILMQILCTYCKSHTVLKANTGIDCTEQNQTQKNNFTLILFLFFFFLCLYYCTRILCYCSVLAIVWQKREIKSIQSLFNPFSAWIQSYNEWNACSIDTISLPSAQLNLCPKHT